MNILRNKVGTEADEKLKFVWRQLLSIDDEMVPVVRSIYRLHKARVLFVTGGFRARDLDCELHEKRKELAALLDKMQLGTSNFNTLLHELKDEPREVTADWQAFYYKEYEKMGEFMHAIEIDEEIEGFE